MTRLALLLLPLLGALASCGDGSGTQEPAATKGTLPIAAEERPQTLSSAVTEESRVPLWEVSDPDTIVYMIGTVPLIPPGTNWQNQGVRAAFGQASTVFLEADFISREGQRSMGVVVAQTAELRSGKTLTQLYKGSDRETVTDALSTIGASASEFGTFRPWFAAVQSRTLAQVAAGGDPAGQLDIVIAREAVEGGKRLRYLESAADMLAVQAAGRDEEDAPYLLALLERLALGQPYYADILSAWYEGDLDRLDFLLNGPIYAAPPQVKERVIIERHQSWAQQLDRVLTDEKGIFLVAIPAGHMVGDESLPTHLRRRGYEVKRY
ncbi:TraB/GumN family protein [Parvularcula maris]|uniref:TraB/GumN family protein n=1 Tax=Parvularcula maris TaxID=2965077 RepID=A0A9X2LAS8_9PROT|nr:TraB/GumN family protein [Parvularcula maris]MCQ8186291.1 TraB/GumN family protein [Parvularcula maris]